MVITTGHPPLKEEAVYTIVMFTQNVVDFSAVTTRHSLRVIINVESLQVIIHDPNCFLDCHTLLKLNEREI